MKSLDVGGRVPLCLSFPIPLEGIQQGPLNPHGFGGGIWGWPWGGHRILGCSRWGCRIPLGLPDNFRVSPLKAHAPPFPQDAPTFGCPTFRVQSTAPPQPQPLVSFGVQQQRTPQNCQLVIFN